GLSRRHLQSLFAHRTRSPDDSLELERQSERLRILPWSRQSARRWRRSQDQNHKLLLRRFAGEAYDLGLVSAAIDVRFAGTMAGFAAARFAFPTRESRQGCVCGVRIGFEGVFVTI